VRFTPRRWRSRLLLLTACVTYWLVLAIAALGPAVAAGWRATHPGATNGTISVRLTNSLLEISISGHGMSGWAGSIHLGALALWLLGPPFLFWMIWLWSESRHPIAPVAPLLSARTTLEREPAHDASSETTTPTMRVPR
jgi:hypothetical protein